MTNEFFPSSVHCSWFTRSAMSSEEFESLRKEVKTILTRARQTLLCKIQECPEESKQRLLNLSACLESLDEEWEKFTLAVLTGRVEELRGAKDHVIQVVFHDFLRKFNGKNHCLILHPQHLHGILFCLLLLGSVLECDGVENNFALAHIPGDEQESTVSDLKPEEDPDFASDVAPFLLRNTVKEEDGGRAAEKDMIVLEDKHHRGPTNVPVRPAPAYTHEEG